MSNGTILGNYASKGGPSSNKSVNTFFEAIGNYVKTSAKVDGLVKLSKATADDYKDLNEARNTVIKDFVGLSCSDMNDIGSSGLAGGEKKAEEYTSAINYINDSKNGVGRNIAKLVMTAPEKLNCIIGGYNSQSTIKTKLPPLDVDKFTDSVFTELSTTHRVAETCLGRVLIISLVIVGLLCLLFLGLFISASKKLKRNSANNFSRQNTY